MTARYPPAEQASSVLFKTATARKNCKLTKGTIHTLKKLDMRIQKETDLGLAKSAFAS